MERNLDVSLTGPTQTERKIVLALSCLLGIGILFFTDSYWPDGEPIHEAIEWTGVVLIVVCILGRTWCSLYISNRKSTELVQDGPYSVVRNPLYVFSTIGALGVGAQTGGITAALVCGVVAWAVFLRMAQLEEDYMFDRFGSEYFYYSMRVPRFWPDWSLYHSRQSLEVFPAQIARTFLDASIFLAAVPVMQLFDYLHDMGQLPTRIWLP